MPDLAVCWGTEGTAKQHQWIHDRIKTHDGEVLSGTVHCKECSVTARTLALVKFMVEYGLEHGKAACLLEKELNTTQELNQKLQQDNRDLLQDIQNYKQKIANLEQTITNLKNQAQIHQQTITQLNQALTQEKAQLTKEITLIKEVLHA